MIAVDIEAPKRCNECILHLKCKYYKDNENAKPFEPNCMIKYNMNEDEKRDIITADDIILTADDINTINTVKEIVEHNLIKELLPASEYTTHTADLFIFCEKCSKKDSCKEYTDGHKERPCYHSLMIKAEKCKEKFDKDEKIKNDRIETMVLYNNTKIASRGLLARKRDSLDSKDLSSGAYISALTDAIEALDLVIENNDFIINSLMVDRF